MPKQATSVVGKGLWRCWRVKSTRLWVSLSNDQSLKPVFVEGMNSVSLCAVLLFLHSPLLFLPFSWAVVQSRGELATSLNLCSPKAGHSCKHFAHGLSLLLPRSSVAPEEVSCLPFSHKGQSKVNASSPEYLRVPGPVSNAGGICLDIFASL